MPTARMRGDGALTVTSAQQDTSDIYSLTYQALPWMEASFRYTVFNPGDKRGVKDFQRDRSFEVKAKLLDEGQRRPAVAVGIRDIFGTGVLAGEYLVASKRIGSVDVTAGIGWGRFAERNTIDNPLELIDERLGERKGFVAGDQGQPLEGTFFRGPKAGFFGSLEWELPRWNITLLGEMSSDRNEREIRNRYFDDTSPFNYGIRWTPAPGLQLTASHQLGHDFALSVSAQLDTLADVVPKRPPSFISSSEPRSVSGRSDSIQLGRWYDRLLYDIERSGLLLLSAKLEDNATTAWLEIENLDFAYPADAVRRVLSFAEVHLPRSVKTVNVVLQDDEIVAATISYARRSGTKLASETTWDGDSISVLPSRRMVSNPQFRTKFRIPNLATSVNVSSRFQLMDPDDPLRYQIFASIGAAADLGRGFYLRGAFSVDLYNDFEDIDRASNSELPRVRSLVASYLQEGDTGIASLFLEKRGMLSDEIAFRGYAGILEDMYSGVGGEVLWRRHGSRIAYGANVNWVKQRDFDRLFSHRDYEVTTGHLSVYWASPIAGYDFAVHAGRFLARDIGAAFELRRSFDNGWMIGLFATFTDVPFDEFGEGSFDKGMFFRIPFNSFVGGNTRATYNTRLRLLQRDGGQRLEDFGTTLWWDARTSRVDALVRNRARMVPN